MLGIHGKGCPAKSVLDFIFLWFCPVFVPSGICITIHGFVILLNINDLQMTEARKMR